MKKFVYATLFSLFCLPAVAHELTPTYFSLQKSNFSGVNRVEMLMFNRREDVSYYEISAFTEEWQPIPFVTSEKIVKVGYLERKNIELFFRDSDKSKLEFICTKSRLVKGEVGSSGVSSRICSRMGPP